MRNQPIRSRGRLIRTVKPHYDKVEIDVTRSARINLDEVPFLAIIEVVLEDYIPSCVSLRTRISPFLFTARVEPPALRLLQDDTAVVSIAPGQQLLHSA